MKNTVWGVSRLLLLCKNQLQLLSPFPVPWSIWHFSLFSVKAVWDFFLIYFFCVAKKNNSGVQQAQLENSLLEVCLCSWNCNRFKNVITQKCVRYQKKSSMEEHVYRTPVTAPHFKILENYYTPNHSTNVLLLSSNFRELASTEPSAMCSKQTAFANCIQRCQWHTVFCTMEINLQWNQVAAFLAGNIDALSTLKNRHRQNDESSEKSKKNDDEKLDKRMYFP